MNQEGALTVNELSCLRGAWTPVRKKICLCLFVCLKNKLNSSLSLNKTIKWTRAKFNG